MLKSTLQKQGKKNSHEDSEGDSELVEEGGHKKKKAKKSKVLSIAHLLALISDCS